MRGRCSTRVFAVLLVAAGWGSPVRSATAPTDAPYTPQMFSYGDGRIALIEAVRLTLANDPNLLLKQQDVRQQAGVAQELRGAFDAVLNGNLQYSFKEQQVRASRIKSEQDKRDQASQTRDDACDSVTTNQQTLAELQAAQGSEPGSISVPSDPSLDTQLKFLDSLINSAPTFEEKQALLNTRLDFLNAEIAQQQRNIADAQFACGLAGDALTRLGQIPEFEQTAHGEFSLRLDKLLRSGIKVAPYINAQYDHDQFKGKHNGFSQPLIDEFGNVVKGELGTPVQEFVDFGGTNIEDLYKITLGFEVNLPLLRGRGAASVAAPERSAERDLEGASLLLKHRASESVLASVTAYWNLLAARQRVDVLRRSVDLQEQLVKITDQLITGDEVPKSERSRALAGQATSQAQLQAGEGDLVTARMALAQAMGLAVESERNAPLADGPFPPSPDPAQLAALDATLLAREASTRRFDLRAAEAGVDSRVLLAEAARLNTRSRLDFKGSAFGTSIGETHMNEALKDPSRPGASLQLTYEKPFGNNTLLGRQEQADAQLRQKQIAATDLDRTVKIAVVQGLETLIQAVDRLKHAEAAGQYSQETIDGEVEKLKAGESTLVDTIVSEQQRTSSLLDLISARQQVAVLLAQLRFQTGTMVHEVAGGNTQVSPEDLTTLPTSQAAPQGGGNPLMRVAAPGWILLASLAAQPALFGQVQAAIAPPTRLDGPRMALAAAVDQTLRDSPDLHQAEAVLAERRGAERSARGAFDGVLSAVPRLNYLQLSLTPTQLQAEVNRRLRFKLPAEKLDQAAIAIVQAKPTDASLLFSDCRLANTVIRVEIGEGKPPAFICFDSNDQVIGFVLDGQDLGFSSIGISALRRLELFNLLQKNGVSISLDTQETLAAFSDLIRFLSRQLHIAADSLRVQRGWLGSVPTDEETYSFATDISYQWRHRAGVALTAMLSLQSSEDNFVGKPLDPVFGDTLNPNVHTATLGLTLDLPLGKGRGRVSADAPEKAARAAADAAEHLIDQTAAEQALATVQAYLEVAAAEERLELLETSVDSLLRIDQGTRELQRADQVAAIEVTRAAGRLAQAQAGLADARQKLEVARLGLQRAMGAPSVPLAETPLAAQSLADLLAQEPAAAVEPDAVVSSALAARFDLQAATKLSESNQILLAASRADLKRQVDLSINASYNGLHESFNDRWYDMRGFNRAMSGVIAGPSYGMTLRFALPFGNNAAYGRMVQADAQFARSEISRVDLGRTIRSRVLQIMAALDRSRLALAAARAAAGYADETFASSVERFKGGELSIIDTLTTEDQVTSARLALVEASRSHLSLLAQLRFEANALLLAAPTSGESHRFQLAPLGAPLR